jgi:formate dehydrogenase assembly factor FdhD
MSKTSAAPGTAKISTFVLLIVLIVLALSIAALGLAANAFLAEEETLAAYLLAIGAIAMTLSVYVLLQSRRHVANIKIVNPAMMTTIECGKCGVKNVREFQRGDYVFKELEPCQKCPDTKMMITAIYKEIKEKEKPSQF